MAKKKEATEDDGLGALARAGFRRVPNEPARRYIDPKGREVSYREAFKRATGRTFEAASRAGKFRATTEVAKQIRDAAREHKLSEARLLTDAQERRLSERTVKSLMRGHTFRSALRRGIEASRGDVERAVERKSPFGKLLGILHAGESGHRFGKGRNAVELADERVYLRRYFPEKYGKLFGPESKKARLLVAMGRRDAGATYDVGETP